MADYESELSLKKRLISLLGFFSVIIAGCATTTPQSFYSPLPEDKRTQIWSVAVGPGSFTPTGHFFTYAKGRPPGAANRAAEGAILGAAMGVGREQPKEVPIAFCFFLFFWPQEQLWVPQAGVWKAA